MYDSNGDNVIDFKEYFMMLYISMDGTPEQKLKKVKFTRALNSSGIKRPAVILTIVIFHRCLFHTISTMTKKYQKMS